MERTDLRAAFFAEVKLDPYAAVIFHHVTEAWADGYEQALRDNELDDQRFRESRSDRVRRAVEWMTDQQREAHAKALIALAQIGHLAPPRGI